MTVVKCYIALFGQSSLTLFILDTGKQGNLANSEQPGEMPHNAAFHQSLHCLPK